MILDNFTFLSGSVSAAGVLSGQLVTANSTLGTNTMDLGPLSLGGNQVADLGAGEPTSVEFSVLVAPATATDVTFQLIQADDAALTTNVQVIAQTGAFPIASLPAGTIVPLAVDRAAPFAPKRYIGVRYVATGTTITALSVAAALVKNVQDLKNIYFKSGFAIV
ncbi:hypothetical protein UFOVP61_3 [uncultured Caudovirales phage]|uniref:Uncharacterized protein n=1 Tax=uncultured Caudovirales phage TaxID=2100421 RepID=A0A6J5KRB8_9CAUD|nr:hypothetical protein UFOVP61_3 [uncultured Caudovirales phage]